MSRPIRLVATAALALVAWMALAGAAQAATWQVHPGQSIQNAVNQANPGDTIAVDAGVYRQSVTIRKPDITLQGAGGDAAGTVLRPNPDSQNACFVHFASGICALGQGGTPVSGTVITGFRVERFPGSGILLLSAGDSEVAWNRTLSNGEYGIAGFVQQGIHIAHNIARNSGEAGVYVGDSPEADAAVEANTVTGNLFGLFLRDSSWGEVTGNHATGNCAGALFLDTESPVDVAHWRARGNWASDNTKACPAEDEAPAVSGVGMLLIGTEHMRIAANTTDGNVPSGPSFASGGIVLSDGAFAGGGPLGDVIVRVNHAHDNEPADLVWDETGTDIDFVDNDCDTSQPDGLCA